MVSRKTFRKYLTLFSVALFLGIFALTAFAYFSYQEQSKKTFMEDSVYEFEATVNHLNKIAKIKRSIDNFDNTNAQTTDTVKNQIKEVENVLNTSQKQTLKSGTQTENEETRILAETLAIFYGEINTVYLEYLEYLKYFDGLNQIVNLAQENKIKTESENNKELVPQEKDNNEQQIRSQIWENISQITPPEKLEQLHRALLFGHKNNENGREPISFANQIKNIYTNFDGKMGRLNRRAKEIKQALISEQKGVEIKPLTSDIETW